MLRTSVQLRQSRSITTIAFNYDNRVQLIMDLSIIYSCSPSSTDPYQSICNDDFSPHPSSYPVAEAVRTLSNFNLNHSYHNFILFVSNGHEGSISVYLTYNNNSIPLPSPLVTIHTRPLYYRCIWAPKSSYVGERGHE